MKIGWQAAGLCFCPQTVEELDALEGICELIDQIKTIELTSINNEDVKIVDKCRSNLNDYREKLFAKLRAESSDIS